MRCSLFVVCQLSCDAVFVSPGVVCCLLFVVVGCCVLFAGIRCALAVVCWRFVIAMCSLRAGRCVLFVGWCVFFCLVFDGCCC